MGSTASCCVKRGGPDEQTVLLERRNSWQSVNDPDDFLTFFDCLDDDSLGGRSRPNSIEMAVFKRPTLHSMGSKELQFLDSVPEHEGPPPPQLDPVDEEAVERVANRVREAWLARSSSDDLDDELKGLLKEGFPELKEWTAASTVRRMIRAACGEEDAAVDILEKAIACRVRKRALFQSMKCTVTCDARVIGMDTEQRPVVYMNTGSQTSSLREMLPQLFLACEAAVRIGHPEGQIMLIADMVGVKVRPNMDRVALAEMSNSFGTVHADRLNFILIVDFSYMAQALWSLCQPLLSDRTRSKIQFVSEREARKVCQERLSRSTYLRVHSSFDINRDPESTREDRAAHAKRTSICDVPLGAPQANEPSPLGAAKRRPLA